MTFVGGIAHLEYKFLELDIIKRTKKIICRKEIFKIHFIFTRLVPWCGFGSSAHILFLLRDLVKQSSLPCNLPLAGGKKI